MLLVAALSAGKSGPVRGRGFGGSSCAGGDRAGPSLPAAGESGGADHERRHGADDGRRADLRLCFRPVSGFTRSLDVARRSWPGARLCRGWRGGLVAGKPDWRPSGAGTSLRSRGWRLLRHGRGYFGSGDEGGRSAVRAVTASMTLSVITLALLGRPTGRALPGRDRDVSAPLAPILAMAALGVFNTALAYYVDSRLVARGRADIREPQQLCRAADRRDRRRDRARRTRRIFRLGRSGARVGRRGSYRPSLQLNRI